MGGRDSWSWRPNQSRPARAAPTAPGPGLPSLCVISLIQQNTCSAVATLQAAGELWGAPGPAPGCPRAGSAGREAGGSGRARAHGPLLSPPPAVASACGQESSPCQSHPQCDFPAAVQGSFVRGSHTPEQGGSGLQMRGKPHRGYGLPWDHPPGLEPGSACPLGTLVSPCPLIPANQHWGKSPRLSSF